MLPQTTDDRSLRSFWQRKEGTAGMLVLALLGVGGLFIAQALLPTIISVFTMGVVALGQALMLSLLAVALAALGYVLFMSPVPKLVGYWFKASVRRATNVFVAVYPIEIMQEFISKLIAKKQAFTDKKADIAKVKRNIEETIAQNKKEHDEALLKMAAAKKQNMPMEVQLAARQAGMLEAANARQGSSLATVSKLYTQLERVEKVCDFKVRDMQFQVKMLNQDNKTSKAIKGAVSAAAAILRGSDADQELYDSAVEYVVEDYRSSLGLIDDFMSSTDSILNGFDLQNGMWEEAALQKMSQIEETERLLISGTPSASELPSVRINDGVPLPTSNASSKYF